MGTCLWFSLHPSPHQSSFSYAALMRVTRCSARSARHDPICASASGLLEQSLPLRYRYLERDNGGVEKSMGDLGDRVDNFNQCTGLQEAFEC